MEENYIVSARKYRPSTFSSVVGQKALTATLRNAIASNRLAHAYLFCGSRGVGKTSCARIFAKTINCEHPTPQGDPCNECPSCRAFNEGRSLNILELDAASNNSVNDIRELVDQVQIPPTEGRYRVFIIDEVHMLSSQAFNAFLKTLEEPPAYVVFILATTEKHKIIPTILSRCQIYDFARITISDIVDHLEYVAGQEGITTERAALNVIAQKADGAMRDALSIFDQVAASSGGNITYQSAIDNLNVLDERYYLRLFDAFVEGNVPQAMIAYKDIRDHGFDSHFFVNGLAQFLRDMMLAKDEQTASLLDTAPEVLARLKEQSARLTPEFFYTAMSLCNEADLNYRLASNKTFLVELLLIRLCQQACPSPTCSGNGEGRKLRAVAPAQGAAASAATQPSHAAATPAPAATPPSPSSAASTPPPAPSPAQPPAPAPKRIDPTPFRAAQASAAGRPMGRGHVSFRSAFESEEQQERKSADTSTRSSASAPFTTDRLIELWDGYMKHDPKAHVLNNTLRMHKPLLPEGSPQTVSSQQQAASFVVTVVNRTQVDALEQARQGILENIRRGLGNDYFNFSVTVDESAVPATAWSDTQILDHLVETTPQLAKFISDLSLKIY